MPCTLPTRGFNVECPHVASYIIWCDPECRYTSSRRPLQSPPGWAVPCCVWLWSKVGLIYCLQSHQERGLNSLPLRSLHLLAWKWVSHIPVRSALELAGIRDWGHFHQPPAFLLIYLISQLKIQPMRASGCASNSIGSNDAVPVLSRVLTHSLK